MNEIWALLVRIRALRELSDRPSPPLEAALAEPEAWIRATGAISYHPFLDLERAEIARSIGDDAARVRNLSEAHGRFVAIGATARAERLAREIAIEEAVAGWSA